MYLEMKEALPEGSWFREWLNHYPNTEPPDSYKLFTALATMGAILGRKVTMKYDVHEIRPMLNLLLIGPSGIGKSTSVKMARKALLKEVADEYRPQFIEGSATREKLHVDLRTNPHAILFAPELAAFFSKESYKEGLIPYVTNLLDYEDRLEMRTRKDGTIAVEMPEVTVIGASTREWLQGMLPDSAVTGGFLARFLLLFEERGHRIPNPHRQFVNFPEKEAKLLQLRKDGEDKFRKLISDAFQNALQHPEGIDYEGFEAADRFGNWYRMYQPDIGLLSPFQARAGEMVLRLSIILAVSCGRFFITVEDIQCAIKLYEYQASKLAQIVVPVSDSGKMLATVLEAIPPGGISAPELFRAMRNVGNALELGKAINSLQLSKDVGVEKGKYFRTDV